jgi:hypothetical protein
MLALFAFVDILWTDVPAAPFSLVVVPTKSFGDQHGASITMANNKPRDFYVVLTNVSKEPQAVWEYWNSWGYQTISFELTTADGRKMVISKRPQMFMVNFPSIFLIQPGEHYVYVIRLDKEWQARPTVPKAGEMSIKLKAIYEVSATPEATQYKVWTGRLESHIYSFTLRQW